MMCGKNHLASHSDVLLARHAVFRSQRRRGRLRDEPKERLRRGPAIIKTKATCAFLLPILAEGQETVLS